MSFINIIKKQYTKFPLWATNILAPFYYCIPISKRYGRVFEKQSNFLNEIESLSDTKIEELINLEFISLVNHAYKNVPYYHKLFNEHGISISSFKDIRDIKKIPFLTKEILIEHRDELVATNIDKKDLLYITTSGSTGTPTGFYVDSDSTMKEWAYTLNLWKRVGYRPDSSRLVLRGKVFWRQKNVGQNWQYDAFKRELSCNIFDFSEENLEQYCKAIEKYKPEFVHGYTSAIVTLCKYIERRSGGLNHQFKSILAVSENVLDSDRQYIEKILNARVFSFYGHSERLVMAGECEYSTDYHIEPLYGYAEIVDVDGNVIMDDKTGELVATGFCNKGMPMLRYKTGDMATWSQKESCECGRPYLRLSKVDGRKREVLINKDGDISSIANISNALFDKVIRYKFYQDSVGKAIVKIVPQKGFKDNDKTRIISELNARSMEKITYTIEFVDNIPINKNGKHVIVEQKLDISKFTNKEVE